MRFTRRITKIEHAIRNIPDPREAERAETERWRFELYFDLAYTDKEANELVLAFAERTAHEGVGDPELSKFEDEKYRSMPTAEIQARLEARMDEVMKQRGFKDIEEWVPTGYGMREQWERRQRMARRAANTPASLP